MKQLLLIPLLFFTLITYVMAQESATIVFRNAATNREYTIRRGDFVKIRMDEANGSVRYKGAFRGIKNGQMILKGKPGIPLDHIQRIKYRPVAMRILFWTALIIGAIIADIGFLSVFVVDAAWPQILAAVGQIMVVSSFLISPLSLRRIDEVQTDWTYEIRFLPPPVQQMAPIP